jgi:hypothetical protein
MPHLRVSPAYCGPLRKKRRAQLGTAIEIFYHFSPCPGSNKTIAGGEVGELFGSTVPVRPNVPTAPDIEIGGGIGCRAKKPDRIIGASQINIRRAVAA